ncbi:hypothetical protein Tco_1529858, partial [Tanacetum coccineum]
TESIRRKLLRIQANQSLSDEDESDNDVEGAKVAGAKSGEDAIDAKDQGNEAVKDSNTDLDGRDKVMTDVEWSLSLPSRSAVKDSNTDLDGRDKDSNLRWLLLVYQ